MTRQRYYKLQRRIGKVDVVRKPLELGADPRLSDGCGWSPLRIAKAMKNQELLNLLTEATARHGQRLLPPSSVSLSQ